MMSALRCSLLFLLGIGLGSGSAEGILPDDFQDQLVTGGFDRPSGFAFLPDGRILVVEQSSASVQLVAGGILGSAPVLTLPDVDINGSERGLLGVAVDAGFPARPYVYFHYTQTPSSSIYITRYTAGGDLDDPLSFQFSLASPFVLLDDLPDEKENHNGGTVRFGPDGMLYISIGDDGSKAGACLAQNSTAYHGSILRIDVSGIDSSTSEPPPLSLIAPSDNPYQGAGGVADLVFCIGLRNPFRFTIDSLTGALYIGDVGDFAFEEMSEARGGENLGWPFREGPIVQDFPTFPCEEPGGPGTQSYTAPIANYPHGPGQASVIAGPSYRAVSGAPGNFPPLYDGAVFYADFYQGFLRVAKKAPDGSWAPLDSVPGQPDAVNWGTGLPWISDLQVGPDGSLYYTRLVGGEFRRIVYTGPPSTGVPHPSRPRLLPATPTPARSGQAVRFPGSEGETSLQILTVTGRRIRTLRMAPGLGLVWDGRNQEGRPVPAGLYLARSLATGSAGRGWRVMILP